VEHKTLFKGALLETVSNGAVVGDLLIADATITAVGGEICPTPDMDVVDCAGRVICPGFVDAYTVLGLHEDGHGEIGYDEDEGTNPSTPQVRAIDGFWAEDVALADCRAAGVTSAMVLPGYRNVFGGQAMVIRTTGETAAEMVRQEPAGITVSLRGTRSTWGHTAARARSRSEDVALFRRSLLKLLGTPADQDNTSTDLGEPILRSLLDRSLAAYFMAQGATDILNALELTSEFGLRSVIVGGAEAHLVTGEIKKAGVPVVMGPTMVTRYEIGKYSTLKTPAILAREGVQFAIGSGHPVIPSRYLFAAAATAVAYGLSREAALRSITLDAAGILGMGDSLGSLDVGKNADLVVMTGEPFSVDTQVLQTYCNGHMVFAAEEARA
jgi:imidazolonepropionase-like amidohydrolase